MKAHPGDPAIYSVGAARSALLILNLHTPTGGGGGARAVAGHQRSSYGNERARTGWVRRYAIWCTALPSGRHSSGTIGLSWLMPRIDYGGLVDAMFTDPAERSRQPRGLDRELEVLTAVASCEHIRTGRRSCSAMLIWFCRTPSEMSPRQPILQICDIAIAALA